MNGIHFNIVVVYGLSIIMAKDTEPTRSPVDCVEGVPSDVGGWKCKRFCFGKYAFGPTFWEIMVSDSEYCRELCTGENTYAGIDFEDVELFRKHYQLVLFFFSH